MAVLYVGIDRMLADMQWSTKSAYQIQSTFYIISQRSAEDLLSQTSLNKASRPVLWKRENRSWIETAIFIRGQDESSGGASAASM
jgi:hypothetical protein